MLLPLFWDFSVADCNFHLEIKYKFCVSIYVHSPFINTVSNEEIINCRMK
jgi:hypothetical protein